MTKAEIKFNINKSDIQEVIKERLISFIDLYTTNLSSEFKRLEMIVNIFEGFKIGLVTDLDSVEGELQK